MNKFEVGSQIKFTEDALARELSFGYLTQNSELQKLLDGESVEVTMVTGHYYGGYVYIGTREAGTLLAICPDDVCVSGA